MKVEYLSNKNKKKSIKYHNIRALLNPLTYIIAIMSMFFLGATYTELKYGANQIVIVLSLFNIVMLFVIVSIIEWIFKKLEYKEKEKEKAEENNNLMTLIKDYKPAIIKSEYFNPPTVERIKFPINNDIQTKIAKVLFDYLYIYERKIAIDKYRGEEPNSNDIYKRNEIQTVIDLLSENGTISDATVYITPDKQYYEGMDYNYYLKHIEPRRIGRYDFKIENLKNDKKTIEISRDRILHYDANYVLLNPTEAKEKEYVQVLTVYGKQFHIPPIVFFNDSLYGNDINEKELYRQICDRFEWFKLIVANQPSVNIKQYESETPDLSTLTGIFPVTVLTNNAPKGYEDISIYIEEPQMK